MDDIMLKYETLSPDIQKEVNDFLDFMLLKYKGERVFDMKSWKAKSKISPPGQKKILKF